MWIRPKMQRERTSCQKSISTRTTTRKMRKRVTHLSGLASRKRIEMPGRRKPMKNVQKSRKKIKKKLRLTKLPRRRLRNSARPKKKKICANKRKPRKI